MFIHLRVCWIACLACLRAHVLAVFTCLRACVFGLLTFLRAAILCVLGVLMCLACLHAWCACECACLLWRNVLFSYVFAYLVCFFVLLTCFTFQYLNLKILTAKNLCALLSWTHFLFTFWYQVIKLFETNLREAGKWKLAISAGVIISYRVVIDLWRKNRLSR